MTRCRYLRRGAAGMCTAEAVDDLGEIMLCQRHLARAVELLAARGFTVLLPASSRVPVRARSETDQLEQWRIRNRVVGGEDRDRVACDEEDAYREQDARRSAVRS